MPTKGYTQTPEHRARLSAVRRCRAQTPLHVARRISSGLQTRANWSDEQKARVALSVVSGRRTYSGSENPNYRGGKRLPCSTCGTEIWVRASHLIRSSHYCDKTCERQGKTRVPTADDLIRRNLNSRMARLMNQELGRAKAGRTWESLAGYSVADLRLHLERLFVDGMTWDNRRLWHIDHKRPRASFVFVSAEDQAFKECWALSNLQPLWAVQNLRKGARIVEAA